MSPTQRPWAGRLRATSGMPPLCYSAPKQPGIDLLLLLLLLPLPLPPAAAAAAAAATGGSESE